MKMMAGLALMFALLLPHDAEAQRRARYNAYSFSPYAGAFKDAYDAQPDGSNLGYIVGFRAGFEESERLNFHLDLGYARSNDVAIRGALTAPNIDNQWVIATGGADFALVPGNTSIAVGLDLGIGWRRTREQPVGGIDVGASDGWGTYEVVAPALLLRHRFSPRTALFLTVQDYIFDVLEGSAEHSPSLKLGLSFR